jgi:hypothetical protein
VQFELTSGFTVKKSVSVIPWPITIALHVSPACVRYHFPHAAELPGPVELGMGAAVVGLGVGIAVVETPTLGQPPFGDRHICPPTRDPMD